MHEGRSRIPRSILHIKVKLMENIQSNRAGKYCSGLSGAFSYCSAAACRVCVYRHNIPEALNVEHSHRGAPQSQCSQHVLQHEQMCLVILTPLWTSIYFVFVFSSSSSALWAVCLIIFWICDDAVWVCTWSGKLQYKRTWRLGNMQNMKPGGKCKSRTFRTRDKRDKIARWSFVISRIKSKCWELKIE